jgi:hypothetical protein
LALLPVCLRRVVLPGLAGNRNHRGNDGSDSHSESKQVTAGWICREKTEPDSGSGVSWFMDVDGWTHFALWL